MSFETICSSCGAPSSPSVGTCPFCKSNMSTHTSTLPEGGNAISKAYAEGRMDNALQFLNMLFNKSPELFENEELQLLRIRILLETEAPTAYIKAVLAEGLMRNPESASFQNYLDILNAREKLGPIKNDAGEKEIASVLKRDPNNVYALFILGTHLFHVDKEPARAIQYLEKCVQIRPVFLRAWGCLGTIYAQLNSKGLAARAFNECLKLETDETMKRIFQDCINQQRAG